jgi:hypothetical protein
MELAHGIGAPSYAGQQHISEPAESLGALLLGLLKDHGVEVEHRHRV